MSEVLKANGATEGDISSLEEVQSFDEHMEEHHPRTAEQRLQRFMEMSGIKGARADDEKFSESLRVLDPDKAYNILSHINVVLRDGKLHERGRVDDVTVGEHVAPAEDVQMEVLEDATEALGEIQDTKHRAAMSYFVINGLHLFPDGNGRTSRAVYEVLENPEFDLGNKESLKHHDTGVAYGHEKFEREKEISSAEIALGIALRSVTQDMLYSGDVSEKFGEHQTNLQILYGAELKIHLTDEAKEELSDEEKKAVDRAFMDGDIALLALAKMLTEKGTYDEIAEASTLEYTGGEKIVGIEVTEEDFDRPGQKNELAQKTFSGWRAEDYRQLLETIKDIQRLQYKKLISFFTSPDKYTCLGGKCTVADWLVGRR
ncbi:Fic family protein [Candidatus Saccharibacteria bacterium]|nr:Fic family protein [Candidatus Saccharibacteria bacterium]